MLWAPISGVVREEDWFIGISGAASEGAVMPVTRPMASRLERASDQKCGVIVVSRHRNSSARRPNATKEKLKNDPDSMNAR
jgi:hypothetical protein